MLTQLPIHKDKDFQLLNFFMQMLIVSIVYIAGCVEYLNYKWKSKVINLSPSQSSRRSSVIRTVHQQKQAGKNFPKYSKMPICQSYFFQQNFFIQMLTVTIV